MSTGGGLDRGVHTVNEGVFKVYMVERRVALTCVRSDRHRLLDGAVALLHDAHLECG